MAQYDENKVAQNPQGTYPPGAVAGTEWARTEPLLTPAMLVSRFLFGIPLVSQTVNPITRKADVKSPDVLKDHILRAVATLEAELGFYIFPVQFEEQHPYDRIHMQESCYLRTKNKPLLSVESLAIRPQNNTRAQDILVMPAAWISITNAQKGQLNLIPTVAGNTDQFAQVSGSNGSAYLLAYIGGAAWAPSFWQLRYTAGMPEHAIPKVLNEIIGTQAALDVLSDIAATFRIASYSLGLDGMSQSQSTPGPMVYKTRIDELNAKKRTLVQRLKSIFGTKLSMGVL